MLLENLKPFIDWLHIHPDWANFFVFVISFAESIAIFGLLVPGSVVMTAIGALVGAGILPMMPIMLAAIFGAVLGDVFSYWLGARLHQNVRNYWPFTRFPQVLTKGEAFFEKHGGKSVFLGRFVGPIRPVIPLIAGMLNMKPLRFFVADIPAAIGWAPLYMLPGILLGQLSLQLQPEIASQFLLVIFAALIVLWLIYWLLKRLIVRLIHSLHYVLTYLWQRYSPKQRWMKFMSVPHDPRNSSQFCTLIFALFLGLMFCLVTLSVFHQGIFTEWDNPIFHLMRSLRNISVDRVMNLLTFLAAKEVMLAISIVVLFYFTAKRNYWALIHWIVLNILCFGGVHYIKNWVQSPRPGSLFFSQYGWSFPSGHTTLILCILGFLVVLSTQKSRRSHQAAALASKDEIPPFFSDKGEFLLERKKADIKRKKWYSLVAALVIAVGISRIYLGFHWFSDVLGGILLGLLIVTITTFSYRTRDSAPIAVRPLWAIVTVAALLAWSIYTFQFLNDSLKNSVTYWPMQTINEKGWWAQSNTEPPLYRTNRFGKPAQLINIQWVGDLTEIQQALFKQGWKIPAKPDLAMIVTSFTNGKKSNLNPIFLTRYHRDRKPALVMTKVVSPQHVIILRLWNSHVMLRKTGYTLWVGTINYYRPWQSFLLRNRTKNHHHKIAAIDYLKMDLHDFRWKEVARSQVVQLHVDENLDWAGYVLLIRPRQ